MVIKGTLTHCKREVKEFDARRKTEEKLFITLADAEVSDEQMMELEGAFADAGKKFTPKWITDFEGYVNVSTQYELPYRDIEGTDHNSIESGISNGLKYMGAEVLLSINIKEGAIYPRAIKFLTEGSSFNAFAEFDE